MDGVATFTNLTLDTARTGYSLEVTGGGFVAAKRSADQGWCLPHPPTWFNTLSPPEQSPPETCSECLSHSRTALETWKRDNGGVTIALASDPSGGILGGALTALGVRALLNSQACSWTRRAY